MTDDQKRRSDPIKAFLIGVSSHSIIMQDGRLAISMYPSNGDIVFDPGAEGSPPWALGAENILEFEIRPRPEGTQEKDGKEIFLRFRTAAGEEHSALIGYSLNAASAERWMSHVNKLYKKNNEK